MNQKNDPLEFQLSQTATPPPSKRVFPKRSPVRVFQKILSVFCALLVVIFLIIPIVFSNLQPYQKARLLSMIEHVQSVLKDDRKAEK